MINDKTHLIIQDDPVRLACGSYGQGSKLIDQVDCPNCIKTKIYRLIKTVYKDRDTTMKCPKCGSSKVNYSCPLSCDCGYVYEETGIKFMTREEYEKKHKIKLPDFNDNGTKINYTK